MLPLSSLLLQRGVATLAEVETALARQSVQGGDLVTNLLEVARVDEAKLIETIADFEGLPAAPTGPLPRPEPDALSVVPITVASKIPMLPQRLHGDCLSVVVAEPIPRSMEQELSFSLGIQFEQSLSCLSRVLQGLAAAYRVPLHRRHARVVARLDGTDDPYPSVAPPSPVLSSLVPSRLSHGPAASSEEPSHEPWVRPPVTVQSSAALSRALAANASTKARRGPFELIAAREALESAGTNTEIVAIFFDFAKQFFEYVALFMVRDDLAEGLAAAGPGVSRDRIRSIGVPLELPGILSRARDEKAHVLDIPANDGIDAVFRQDLQRPMRARVLVAPLAVRSRVIALLYGDDGRSDVDLNLVGDVLALVPLVSSALETLILQKKLQQRSKPSQGAKTPEKPVEKRKRTTLRGLPVQDTRPQTIPPVVVPSASPGPKSSTTSPFVPVVEPPKAPPVPNIEDVLPPDPMADHPAVAEPEVGLRSPSTLLGLGGDSSDAVVRELSDLESEPSPAAVQEPEKALEADTLEQEGAAPDEDEPVAASEPSPAAVQEPEKALEVDTLEQEGAEPDEPLAEPPTVEEGIREDAAAEKTVNEDDAPSISYSEMDEYDGGDLMNVVLAELQRSPTPEAVEESTQAVVRGPLEVPKSQSPADLGLPQVILNLEDEVEELVDKLESTDIPESQAESIRAELRSYGQGWIEPVLSRFPGRAVKIPELFTDESLMVSERGGLLRFVVEQGSMVAQRLLDRMAESGPETRVWLVLTLAEIGGKEAREAMNLALFDSHERVRSAARRVLRSVVGLRAWANGVRSRVRKIATEDTASDRRLLAIQALGEIREGSSVPILLGALDSDVAAIREAAVDGLRSITRQSFDDHPEAWKTWWKDNSQRARYDWLVDALCASDERQREEANLELIDIVGENLGFDPMASESAQERAIQAYRTWWDDEARRSSKSKRKPNAS
ncbi:MAG: bacteriophage N4 adsorption protein B [Deltaproteobacteria bacterium ADurb.Bin207]|nr:MAG: bacteriophage N4 adsorption protein B [Deltaproteobacteria bacterium ADurb.Bin207]